MNQNGSPPKIAIFHGSRATGVSREDSDWDVAVLGGKPLGRSEIGGLRNRYAARLGVSEDSVDIADLGSASPLLRYRAAMEGKLLEGSQHDFREFQLLAWKDYLNNQKMFDLQRKFLKKALRQ